MSTAYGDLADFITLLSTREYLWFEDEEFGHLSVGNVLFGPDFYPKIAIKMPIYWYSKCPKQKDDFGHIS